MALVTSLQAGSHYSPSEEDRDLQRLGWSVDSDGHFCPACIAESGVVTATVTEITPGTRYVVHGLENGRAVAIPVQASSISYAQPRSGLQPPVEIHAADATDCDKCRRALAAEAVSRP